MTDRSLERIIGRLLQIGVLLSAAVVAAGGVWYLLQQGHATVDYGHFRQEAPDLRSPTRLIASFTHPRPLAIVQLGILLLVATPVARVVFSLAAFAWERDRLYVWITLIVLGVLLYSLAVAHAAG